MALDSISWIDFSSHRGTYRTPLRGSIAFYGVDAQCSDFAKSDIFLIYMKKVSFFITCDKSIPDKKLRSVFTQVVKFIFSFNLI